LAKKRKVILSSDLARCEMEKGLCELTANSAYNTTTSTMGVTGTILGASAAVVGIGTGLFIGWLTVNPLVGKMAATFLGAAGAAGASAYNSNARGAARVIRDNALVECGNQFASCVESHTMEIEDLPSE